MNILPRKNRKGIAIAVVLIFCTAILGLITVLVINTKAHRGSHSSQYDDTRALMAARSAIQLAIYKYRVLPAEYYKIHSNGALKQGWLADMQTETADSPAAKIKLALDNGMQASHDFGVEEFALVSRQDSGYTKDYLKIRAWGTASDSRKLLEELVEIRISE